jgi:hypothetical protein
MGFRKSVATLIGKRFAKIQLRGAIFSCDFKCMPEKFVAVSPVADLDQSNGSTSDYSPSGERAASNVWETVEPRPSAAAHTSMTKTPISGT